MLKMTSISTASKIGVHCLLAADLLNFGNNETTKDKVEEEKRFILNLGKHLFAKVPDCKAGIWVYGFVEGNPTPPLLNKETMIDSYNEFETSTDEMMRLTANISGIHNQRKNVDDFRNATLNSTKSKFQRIVAVGFNSLELSKIVIPPNGKSVSLSSNYSEELPSVLHAVLQDFTPNFSK
ncbi:unnamed protein product [Strongylus vulgaris]|uniref:Uncharacterized protein n=1 Tax=Strongylus vulgaris TaxID=40348 RepID=A0A3P7L8A3_STRVU|nr:unnamed protein product [Strongylus vulgaris]